MAHSLEGRYDFGPLASLAWPEKGAPSAGKETLRFSVNLHMPVLSTTAAEDVNAQLWSLVGPPDQQSFLRRGHRRVHCCRYDGAHAFFRAVLSLVADCHEALCHRTPIVHVPISLGS